MGYLGEAGRTTSPGTANQASLDVPLLIDAPAGTTLVLAVQAPVVSAITNFAATDPAGNTWTQQELVLGSTLSNVQLGVLTCKVATGKDLTTGQLIHVTAPPRSPTFWAVLIEAFDDLVDVDKHAQSTGTSSSWPTGTTGAAAQNRQLLFGAWAWASPTSTLASNPAGWTMSSGTLVTPNTPKNLQVGWQYVDAAGTRSATATFGSSLLYGAAIVALNQQAAAAPTYGRYIRNASGVWVPSVTKRLISGVWT